MRPKANAQARIVALRQQLKHHNDCYYRQDRPEITDYEYDLLFRELVELEAEHPEFVDARSPTQTVGDEPKELFKVVRHPYPMGSLENAMSEAEVFEFIQRREKDLGRALGGYSLSMKYDGLAVELVYRNGVFVLGSTRGNGLEGEDVTPNLKTIKNLPKRLSLGSCKATTLVVRGEVVMTKEGFEALNKEQRENNAEPYAQARSAASGSVRQLDPKVTERRDLHCYAYQVAGVGDLLKASPTLGLATQTEQVEWLRKLGFDTTEHHYGCWDLAAIRRVYKKLLGARESLPYETDGVVVKVDAQALQDVLGSAGRRPRYAIAWKFPPTIVRTRLLDISFQVGRTGVITPVAELEPVLIKGAEVRRATLHNEKEIRAKGLLLGDWVEVVRSGDVIPKVLKPIASKRTGKEKPITFPSHCPRCQGVLARDETGQGILIRCVNQDCPATFETKVMHFVSKEAMNIEGLGKELVRQLVERGFVRSLDDLYSLKAEDFDQLDRMGETLRANLLRSIERSKKAPLERFLYALGIRNVGLVTAGILAKKYGSVQSILTSLKKEDLYDINNVGEALSEGVVSFFEDKEVRAMIASMLDKGVKPTPPKASQANGPFAGKRLLFTGKLSVSRNIAKQQAEAVGYEVASSVSRSLDVLVVGDAPGSKLKKAKELGVEVMTEDEFFVLIQRTGREALE